jgi:hypothetical protein
MIVYALHIDALLAFVTYDHHNLFSFFFLLQLLNEITVFEMEVLLDPRVRELAIFTRYHSDVSLVQSVFILVLVCHWTKILIIFFGHFRIRVVQLFNSPCVDSPLVIVRELLWIYICNNHLLFLFFMALLLFLRWIHLVWDIKDFIRKRSLWIGQKLLPHCLYFDVFN